MPPSSSVPQRKLTSVAAHLGIAIGEYDAAIRRFIPSYEEMLSVGAAAIPAETRIIVDLGIGTGAFGARCLARAPRAQLIGIDADPAMADVARRRLDASRRITVRTESFLRARLPQCDAVIASLALHHVRTRKAKGALYRRIHRALEPGGRLVIVDCQPASDADTRRAQFDDWTAHLRRSFTARKAASLLAAWAREDVYVPLPDEIGLLEGARFRVDVLWRRGAFAVILAAAGSEEE